VALASVKLELLTGQAERAAKKLQTRTNELSKKFQNVQDKSNKAGNRIQKFGRQSQTASRGVNKLGAAVKNLLLGLAVIQSARFVIFKTAELESQTKSLEVLTGSLATTKKIIGELQAFGAVTPFTSTDLIETSKRLKAFGVDTERLVKTTKNLADVAGATGAELNGVATAYGQIQAKGKLQTEELLQLQERGIDVATELKDMYNMTGTEFSDALRKGQISAEAVEVAFDRLTSKGGKYFEGAIAQSETLNGKWSTFVDNVDTLARAIGNVLKPVMKDVLTMAIDMLKSINASIAAMQMTREKQKEIVSKATGMVSTAMKEQGVSPWSNKSLTVEHGGETFTGSASKVKSLLENKLVNEEIANILKQQLETQEKINAATKGETETGTGTKPVTPPLLGGDGVDMDKLTSELEKRVKHITAQKELYESMMTTLERKNELLSAGDEFEKSKLIAGHEYEDTLKDIFKIEDKTKQEAAIKLAMQAKTNELKKIEGDIAAINAKKIEEANKKEKEQRKQIADMLANETTNAIMGLIDGTKTLGQTLAGIAKQLASMFLQKALGSSGLFGGLLNTKAEGGYMANGIRPFATGGMATKPTLGLVGEAGEDEYIIPASKMAQSMQRYSAGARGESVIPGTGQSSAGGASGSSTTVNYSGPILNFNSEEFVPKSAIGQIINSAASKGAAAGEARTMSTLRNSRGSRARVGI
jgi:tape measure domain-containing protein